jgi:HEAT repeat protein
MRSRVELSVWGLVLSFVCAATSLVAQTTVPRDQIPADAPKDVKKKIEAMYSANAKERLDAVVDLIKMGPKGAAAVPFLVGILGDNQEIPITINRPGYTIQAKGWPGQSAVAALAAIGPAAVEPTLAALRSNDPLARTRAVAALGELRDRRAIKDLVSLLRQDDSELKKAVVVALQAITKEDHGDDISKWEALVP